MTQLCKYLFWFFLVSSISLLSQNENKKWCFGSSAGLDLTTSPPTVFSAAGINTMEGSSSIADPAGNLLFYTDGAYVWNQQHLLMANGSGMLGANETQGVLIVKQPGNTSLYYIFTAGAAGLCYSIVDMSLAAGMGSVTVKNVVVTSVPQTQKVAATLHCNNVDIWVVSQDDGLVTSHSYMLSSTGLGSTSLTFNTGIINGTYGQMKFSSSGDHLASTDNGSSVQFANFNIATGSITSTPMQIGNLVSDAWGIEFSMDGTRLYGTRNGFPMVYQWDLCAMSQNVQTVTDITNSQFVVTSSGAPKKSIQLDLDGKVYVARPGTNALAVINNPNLLGAACNYVETGQSIAPNTCNNGLPNFVKKRPAPILNFTLNPSSCSTASFSTPGAWGGIITCATYSANVSWDFGDPSSGNTNTSNLNNPTHTFPGPGTYTVKLLFNYYCGTDTVMQVVNVTTGPATLSIAGNLNLCTGETTTLTASGGTSYTWTGNGSPQFNPTLLATPLQPGAFVYTLTGLGTDGCPGRVTTTLNVLPKPVATISGNTIICEGSTSTLSLSGASTYTWNNGSNSSTVSANSSNTMYPVSFTGQNGCVNTITVLTISQPLPTLSLNNGTTCAGSPVTMTALTTPSTGVTHIWTPGGQTGNILTVNPSSTTVYSVTASINGCISSTSNTITVTGLSQPVTSFSYAALACVTQTLVDPSLETNFNSGGVFLSSPGIVVNEASGQVDPSHSEPGTYEVTYTFSQAGCIAAGIHTAQITIMPAIALNLAPVIKIGPGASATLSVSGGLSYTWSPSEGLSCSDCSNPVINPTETQDYCVTSKNGSCESKACVHVEITCDVGFDFSVPNAFTPDGNDKNDEFCLKGWSTCIKSFEVLVFNRWGENVFSSTNADFCWDGTYKGKALNADVFVFVIRATYQDNKVVNKKGNISLIR